MGAACEGVPVGVVRPAPLFPLVVTVVTLPIDGRRRSGLSGGLSLSAILDDDDSEDGSIGRLVVLALRIPDPPGCPKAVRSRCLLAAFTPALGLSGGREDRGGMGEAFRGVWL